MASHTIDVDGAGITDAVARHRTAIAAVVAVATVAAVLLALDGLAVPLETGDALRSTGSAAIAGGESVYGDYAGLWLAVRAILGAYIAFVAALISALALATWREVLE